MTTFYSPFSMWNDIADMERLFGLPTVGEKGLLGGPATTGQTQTLTFRPRLDLFEHGENLMLVGEFPGMTKDSINLELENDVLVISGKKELTEEEKKVDTWYRSERRFGDFIRRIQLPQGVDPDQLKAQFKNGLLCVTIPKPRQEEQRRQLQIEAE